MRSASVYNKAISNVEDMDPEMTGAKPVRAPKSSETKYVYHSIGNWYQWSNA